MTANEAGDDALADRVEDGWLFQTGTHHTFHETLSYTSVPKGGSKTIEAYLIKWAKSRAGRSVGGKDASRFTLGDEEVPRNCTVTFVRDPITHFTSGYAQFAYSEKGKATGLGAAGLAERPLRARKRGLQCTFTLSV